MYASEDTRGNDLEGKRLIGLCFQLWTDVKSREFIATEYPWFLATFDNYSQPIQRADAIRYFVLNHFGGIYIDLDDVILIPRAPLPSLQRDTSKPQTDLNSQGCNRRLDPLRS